MSIISIFKRFFGKSDNDIAIIMPGGKPNGKKAVQAHVYSMEVLPDILLCLGMLSEDTDIYISTDSQNKLKFIKNSADLKMKGRNINYFVTDNKGKDMLPFFTQMAPVCRNYSAICHIHSKKATAGDNKAVFRRYLLACLVRDADTADRAACLIEQHKAGLIFPDVSDFDIKHKGWDGNKPLSKEILKSAALKTRLEKNPLIPFGSMFWISPEIIERLSPAVQNIPEKYNSDDLCHALLRTLSSASKGLGLKTVKIKYK